MKADFYFNDESTSVYVKPYYLENLQSPYPEVLFKNQANIPVLKRDSRLTVTPASFLYDGSSSILSIKDQAQASVQRSANKYIRSGEATTELPSEDVNLEDYLIAFRRASRSGHLEYGMVSKCDELIIEWFERSPLLLGNIINHIFLQSMSDKNVLLSLLKAISSISYSAIYPFGQTVAVAALVNRDIEVIEGGIRAFENWGSRDGISVLENTKLAFEWLEVYRQQTIDYLREF